MSQPEADGSSFPEASSKKRSIRKTHQLWRVETNVNSIATRKLAKICIWTV